MKKIACSLFSLYDKRISNKEEYVSIDSIELVMKVGFYMKKTALYKNIFREISRSKGRFFSIFSLIALGVFALVGLKVTGPNISTTAENYFAEFNLADVSIVSTYGFDQGDQEKIASVNGVKTIEFGYSADYIMKEDSLVIRIFSLTDTLSQYEVVKGSLPKEEGEIALDASLIDSSYQIGDTISLVDNHGKAISENLKNDSFKVVGFVRSSEFIQTTNLGTSQIGTGQLDAFGVVTKDNFDMEVYTIARLTFTDTAGLGGYDDEYQSRVDKHVANLKGMLKNQPESRLNELKRPKQKEISAAEKELEEGRAELEKNQDKLDTAKAELEQKKQEFATAQQIFNEKISEGENQLNDAREQIKSSQNEIDMNRQTIQQNSQQLEEAQTELQEKRNAFEGKQQELNAAQQTFAEKNAQLQASEQELTKSQQELNTAEGELTQAAAELQTAREQLNEQQALLNQQKEIAGDTPEIQQMQAQLDAEKAQLEASEQEISEKMSQLESNKTALEQKWAEFNTAKQELQQKQQELTDAEQTLAASEQKLRAGENTLAEKNADLSAAKEQLAEGERLLQTKKEELEDAEANFLNEKESGQRSLDEAQKKIQQGEEKYQNKLQELEKAKEKLSDAEADIEKAKAKLDSLPLPVYMVRDRNDNPGYSQYIELSQLIDSLSNVFPVFLFAIAALVCLTTMTRMVEEQRTQMGTFKSLGYDNHDILKKFIIYGCTSSVLGAVLGIIIGHQVLPRVIFNALGANYIFESLQINFFINYSLIALVIAVLCTSLMTVFSVRSALKENAVALMRPKPPANGSRILLERFPFIWKRMSFTSKVTARNLFRYKKRMIMTIFGVAGCTALLITGFGIRDSLHGIITPQFDDIIRHDLLSVYNPDSSEAELADYQHTLQSEERISDMGSIVYKSVTVDSKENGMEEVSLITPSSMEEMRNFITLRNRQTQEKLELGDEGAIITEKLAEAMGVEVGDSIEIKDDNKQTYEVKVAGITEMYVGHYLYISPTYYQSIFKEQPQYNATLITLKDASQQNLEQVSDDLMRQDATVTIIQSQDTREAVQNILNGLNGVVFVIIFAASLLAVVVLYNLTNVNVSERIHELSTIKVLGFYPREVTMYVFRETMILTLLGILAGYAGGYFLHRFIIETLSIGSFMFSPNLLWSNFAISTGLTIMFSFIVMIMMHRKLKGIDMIEALKSIE